MTSTTTCTKLSHKLSMVMEQVCLLECLLWQWEQGLPLTLTRLDMALDDKEATTRSRTSRRSLLKGATHRTQSHLRQAGNLRRKSPNWTSPSTVKPMMA